MAKLTGVQIEAVAARADCSTKTVRRYLGGESLLASTMRRVGRALQEEGWGALVRAPAAPAAPAGGQAA